MASGQQYYRQHDPVYRSMYRQYAGIETGMSSGQESYEHYHYHYNPFVGNQSNPNQRSNGNYHSRLINVKLKLEGYDDSYCKFISIYYGIPIEELNIIIRRTFNIPFNYFIIGIRIPLSIIQNQNNNDNNIRQMPTHSDDIDSALGDVQTTTKRRKSTRNRSRKRRNSSNDNNNNDSDNNNDDNSNQLNNQYQSIFSSNSSDINTNDNNNNHDQINGYSIVPLSYLSANPKLFDNIPYGLTVILDRPSPIFGYQIWIGWLRANWIILSLIFLILFIIFFILEWYPWNLLFWLWHSILRPWTRHIYRNGPHIPLPGLSIGFWQGKDLADICSQWTSQSFEFWQRNFGECEAMYNRAEYAFSVLIAGSLAALFIFRYIGIICDNLWHAF